MAIRPFAFLRREMLAVALTSTAMLLAVPALTVSAAPTPMPFGCLTAAPVISNGASTGRCPPNSPSIVSADGQYFGLSAGADGAGHVWGTGGSNAGGISNLRLLAPIVGIAGGNGPLWLVAADGGVFTLGSARFYGSMGGRPLVAAVVGMALTVDQHGYWLVSSDGGVFSFGDAAFYGSLARVRLAAPIVAMTPTVTGRGYWLVGSDGGVFAFGDARFYGSMANYHLAAPIVGISTVSGLIPANSSLTGSCWSGKLSGAGYWLVGRDGGIFAFGEMPFRGSFVGTDQSPVVGFKPVITFGGPLPCYGHAFIGYQIAKSSGQIYSR